MPSNASRAAAVSFKVICLIAGIVAYREYRVSWFCTFLVPQQRYVGHVDDVAELFIVSMVVAPDDLLADHACLFLVNTTRWR